MVEYEIIINLKKKGEENLIEEDVEKYLQYYMGWSNWKVTLVRLYKIKGD